MQGPVFSTANYKLLGISIALLIVGYILLAQKPVDNVLSWTIAPLVLVAVYAVLIPLSVLYKGKEDKEDN